VRCDKRNLLTGVIRSCSRQVLAAAVGLVAAAVGLGLAPGAAGASQVSVRERCNKASCEDNLDFRAAPGETNIVTAADRPLLPSGQNAAFTVSDMGAPLHAGSGCSSIDPHTATCSIPVADTVVPLTFDLGDGNDRLDARRVAEKVVANGGPGDDVLLTGPGDDTLKGGPGHNFLDGGGGVNTADFRDARTPVRVDLQAPGPQGAVGSQDTLRNIQNVDAASTSHDVLRGNASDNFLYGGPYALIDGRAGNDTLTGGPGSHLIGGTGKDILRGSNEDAPLRPPGVRISCGPGFDEVGATLIDTVTADCEHVEPDGGSPNAFVHLVSRPGPRRPFAAWRTGCYEDPPASCDTIVSAHADSPHGPLLALRHIHQRAPRGGVTPYNYSLFLSPAGRRLLRQRHRITVSLLEHIPPYRGPHHLYVPPLLGVRFVLRG